MDDESTQTNKSQEDKIKFDEILEESKLNSAVADESVFDKTLKEIDQIFINLEQKSEVHRDRVERFEILPEVKNSISKINIAKNELTKEENNFIKNNNLLKRIEDLEKNINILDKPILVSDDLKKETLNEIKEHEIDKHLLSLEELHSFEKNNEKKKKNSFSFYWYLILTIVIFITLYGTLNISKNSIVLKYPISEPYINYFYEIIEILKITILEFLVLLRI
jgi:hypothetical protein